MTRTQIIATDWAFSYSGLSGIVLTTIVLMLGAAWVRPTGFEAKLILLVSTLMCVPLITSACYSIPRDEDELKILVGPATKGQVIATKFVSALSMALFVVNIPGLILLEPRFLFNLNALVLLVTTLWMSAEVVAFGFYFLGEGFGLGLLGLAVPYASSMMNSTDSWFPAAMQYAKDCANWFIAHSTFFSIAALSIIPVIVAWSTARRETLVDDRKGIFECNRE